ncbi:hypothetical protein FQN52_008581 [Onygenales sp. PD_12]|nr:hypothetical protein FQN52_008581 [Onygenales sp. PD_12]
MDIEETPVPLPSAPPKQIHADLTIQPPLSRRGHGPGLVIVLPDPIQLDEIKQTLDPPPCQKWAEEGYAVAEVKIPVASPEGSSASAVERVRKGLEALKELPECDVKDKFGLILYEEARYTSDEISAFDDITEIVAIVSYGTSFRSKTPKILHLPGKGENVAQIEGQVTHNYPEAKSPLFAVPQHVDFNPSAANVAHTRNLTFLKTKIGGPYFDLEAIWEEHTYFEFGDRSVAKTMGTMVQEPYVNHIPTITGGIGRDRLTNFYRYHFIWNNPDDTTLELISRSVAIDRIIDEFIFCFTHDKTIDAFLPGVPPTNKPVRLPMVSIVNVRGDRLYHEHIWWDQASLLRQVGLLPEYLPFPYPLPDGTVPGVGRKFEYRVPVAGKEEADKLVDETSVESNEMIQYGSGNGVAGSIREVEG